MTFARIPHHGLQKWLIIQYFYNGIGYNDIAMVDQGIGGSVMEHTPEEGERIQERLASNAHRWASEISNPKKSNGNHVTFAVEENDVISAL